VLVDRDLPFATLIATLHTASDVGFHQYAIVVERWGSPTVLMVDPPASWTEEDLPWPFADVDRGLIVQIDPQSVRTTSAPGAAPQSFAIGAVVAIESAMKRIERQRPDTHRAIVRASGDVPVQALVSTLDALRGSECSLDDEWSEPRAQGCRFWLVTVDLDPPISRRPGRWSDLRVTLAPDKQVWGKRKGPARSKDLRERVERALPAITTCLRESDDARIWSPDHFAFTFGTTEPRKLGVRVFGPLSDALPEDCLAAALDLPLLDGRQVLDTAFHDVGVDIEVPP
jgi:hypothetical protein